MALRLSVLLFSLGLCLSTSVLAKDRDGALVDKFCPHGDLDSVYCDYNKDLVADIPEKPAAPKTLVMGFAANEDSSHYDVYNDFIKHLNQCTKKKVVVYPLMDEYHVTLGMREGRVHLAYFASGMMQMAVNVAGAVPFASKGKASILKPDATQMMLIVRSDSSFRNLSDLKGKNIAHVSPRSNTGDIAARVLLKQAGLMPEEDYKVSYSGRHDRSVLGVLYGFYDAAVVASNMFNQMAKRDEIVPSHFRIVYISKDFPVGSIAYAHNLEPNLSSRIQFCFFNYRFPHEMEKALGGSNQFFPVSYKTNWEPNRLMAEKAGAKFNKQTFDQMKRRAITKPSTKQ